MAARTAWDTVPICEQKWPATLVIPVSARRCMFSFVREVAQAFCGYVADTSVAYEKQGYSSANSLAK